MRIKRSIKCRTLLKYVELRVQCLRAKAACDIIIEVAPSSVSMQTAGQRVFTKDKSIEAQKSKSDAICVAFAFSPQTERTVFADESLSAFYLVAVLVIVAVCAVKSVVACASIPIAAFFNRIPFCLCAVEIYIDETAATLECVIANTRHTLGYGYACNVCTSLERIIANACSTRYYYLFQVAWHTA